VDSIGVRDRNDTTSPTTDDFLPYVDANIVTGVTAPNDLVTFWASQVGTNIGVRTPDSFARRNDPTTNDTANNAASWYGAQLVGTLSTTITYDPTRKFGAGGMVGEVTPGRANLANGLSANPLFLINEVGLNPNGRNDRFQYIEILNAKRAAWQTIG
jgi:hypothetical protein